VISPTVVLDIHVASRIVRFHAMRAAASRSVPQPEAVPLVPAYGKDAVSWAILLQFCKACGMTIARDELRVTLGRSWYKPGRTCWLEALEMLGAKMSAAYWTGQRVHEEMPGLLVNLCAAEHHTTVGEEAAQVLGWIFVKDNNLHHEDWAACSLRS